MIIYLTVMILKSFQWTPVLSLSCKFFQAWHMMNVWLKFWSKSVKFKFNDHWVISEIGVGGKKRVAGKSGVANPDRGDRDLTAYAEIITEVNAKMEMRVIIKASSYHWFIFESLILVALQYCWLSVLLWYFTQSGLACKRGPFLVGISWAQHNYNWMN